MADVGTLTVKIDADTARLNSGVASAQARLKAFNGRVRAMGAGMQSLGRGMAIAATAPILLLGKMGVDELGEIQAANARTAAAIQRIGAGALVSVSGVQKLAGALQAKSGIDDQAIQSGANYLMTLGSIDLQTKAGAAMLDRATTSMTEFADAMGTDAAGAGKLYAKSLAAASEGVVLLPKGVKLGGDAMNRLEASFKKTSNATTRQTLLLNALSAKFKGSMRLTDAERWDVMKDKVAGVSATLLTKLLPTFEKVTEFISKAADKFGELSPRMQGLIGKVALLGGVIGPLLVVGGTLVTAISAIGVTALAVIAVVGAFAAALVIAYRRSERFRAVVQAVAKFLMKHKQAVLLMLGPLGMLAAAFITAWQRSEKFRTAVKAIIAAYRIYISTVIRIVATIASYVGKVASAIAKSQTFKAALDLVRSSASLAWSILKQTVAVLSGLASAAMSAAAPLKGPLKTAFEWFKAFGGAAFDSAISALRALDGVAAAALNTIRKLVDKINSAINKAKDLKGTVSGIGGGALGAIGIKSGGDRSILDAGMKNTIRRVIKKLQEAVADASHGFGNAVDTFTDQLQNAMAAAGGALGTLGAKGDLAASIQRWMIATGAAGEGSMIAVLQKQYDSLLAFLKANARLLSIQDQAQIYQQLTSLLGEINDLKNPDGSTTDVPAADIAAQQWRGKGRGGSGITIHSMTIHANDRAGGEAAARGFMREMEKSNLSRSVRGVKRRMA